MEMRKGRHRVMYLGRQLYFMGFDGGNVCMCNSAV